MRLMILPARLVDTFFFIRSNTRESLFFNKYFVLIHFVRQLILKSYSTYRKSKCKKQRQLTVLSSAMFLALVEQLLTLCPVISVFK